MPKDLWLCRKIQRIQETQAAYEDRSFNGDDLESSFDDNRVDFRVSTPCPAASSATDDHSIQDNGLDWNESEFDENAADENATEPTVLSSGEDSSDEELDHLENKDLDEDENREEDREPLWLRVLSNESCNLKVVDVYALLGAMQIVHKLPDTAMNGFCKLLRLCLPRGNVAPLSYKDVIKALVPWDFAPAKIFTCSSKNCSQILSKLFDICPNSSCVLFGQQQHACAFSTMQVKPQIESIVQAHYSNIRRFLSSVPMADSDDVGDIPSTPAYSSLGENFDENSLRISLILSSDGAQAFKLGRSSFWPCVAIIGELPPTLRVAAENSIVLGFWVGRGDKSKPEWKLFLPPIISELKSVGDGFDLRIGGKLIRITIRILATVLDLPAQASIWGVKQYNGEFGCIRCRHPGERKGTTRLWPKLDIESCAKDEAFYEEAWEYLSRSASGGEYFGVKEISTLSRICNPATVNMFDGMHLVYRGNAQLIFNRLFTSQKQKWTAIFGKSLLSDLDAVIRKIRFPHHFNRRIPSLHAIGSFKASEIKNLLLYAILPLSVPYMQDIPDYWHWIAMYVHAIRLLSKPVVTSLDISMAKRLIDVWQKLIPIMCHEDSQTFNSHAVQHLPDQVKRFGPLWAISTFAFEGFNGHFSRYIKASKGALDQLCRRFAVQQASYKHLAEQVRHQLPLAETVKELMPNLHQRWLIRSDDNRYRLLKDTRRVNDPRIMDCLAAHYPAAGKHDFLFSSRAANGSEILHSTSYSSKSASVVKYVDETAELRESYGEVKIFFSINGGIFLMMEKFRTVMPTIILDVTEPENELLYSVYDDRIYGSFYHIVEKSGELVCIAMTDVLCSAVLVEASDQLTVTDVLPFEHD